MSAKSPIGLKRQVTARTGNEAWRSGAVALQGDLGKPRPALVIQSDLFDAHPSVTILPVTSELRAAPLFRIAVNPNELNGLSRPSQVMVDKPQSIAREKIGAVIGHLDDETMLAVNRALAVFMGFA